MGSLKENAVISGGPIGRGGCTLSPRTHLSELTGNMTSPPAHEPAFIQKHAEDAYLRSVPDDDGQKDNLLAQLRNTTMIDFLEQLEELQAGKLKKSRRLVQCLSPCIDQLQRFSKVRPRTTRTPSLVPSWAS
jgi:hypothetical protein